MNNAPHLYVIAGEPSGDRLGGALMRGINEMAPGTRWSGIGGAEMTARGLLSLFPMEELSVMGLAEVLPRYRQLMRRINETARAVIDSGADALVTIDSPDFCLRVARRGKAVKPDLKVIHYVAPTVWAWRPGRARKMADCVDHVLALFPFEPPFMEAAGMGCDFVGHPVVAEPQATAEEVAAFRATHGLSSDAPLILALPGSRMGEVGRLCPVFGAALTRVVARHPDARIVVPTVGAVAQTVAELTRTWPGAPILLEPGATEAKRAAFAAADVALAASGTVSLELAAARTPMVIGYDMAWLSRQIIGRLLKVNTVTLVNLVSDTRAVPEFIGDACRPEALADALLSTLSHPETQLDAMRLTMERLGEGGERPGHRAARAVLDVVG
ncbi:MAG: lipid-A-disaccharide synthase [Confluentimicrobium sp.]|nr:lipid-A-disaccharide synthase [Actibacterium sp.]